jgi:hypothetical protein
MMERLARELVMEWEKFLPQALEWVMVRAKLWGRELA